MTIGEFMKRWTNNPCFILVTIKKRGKEVFCEMGDSERMREVSEKKFKNISFVGNDPIFTI